jgi:hypothetical protein
MASLPVTSNLPAPSALIALDWKVACGNFGTLNQTGLGSSASTSGAPKLALPMSIVKLTLPASGFFGSKAIWASNLRKWPSTGTPICLLTKAISLLAASSFCCASAGADVPARTSSAAVAAQAAGRKTVIGNSREMRTCGFRADRCPCGRAGGRGRSTGA